MVKRQIIWTTKANIERKEILEFWIVKNKSKDFSLKLNKLITEAIDKISTNPWICRKTDFENIRVKIVKNYLIFYEFNDFEIKILSIWDGRREEVNLLQAK